MRNNKYNEVKEQFETLAIQYEHDLNRLDEMINKLLNELNESELQTLRVTRSNLDKMNSLISLNKQKLSAIYHDFQQDIKMIENEYKSSSNMIKNDYNKEIIVRII